MVKDLSKIEQGMWQYNELHKKKACKGGKKKRLIEKQVHSFDFQLCLQRKRKKMCKVITMLHLIHISLRKRAFFILVCNLHVKR